MSSKWGLDGASSQTLYKQKMQYVTLSETDESSVFMTSFVPLKLYAENSVIWENPTPFCRPIKFQYQKESVQLFQQEFRE